MPEATPLPPSDRRRRLGQALREPDDARAPSTVASARTEPVRRLLPRIEPRTATHAGEASIVSGPPIARPASHRATLSERWGWILALIVLPVAAITLVIARPDLGPSLLPVQSGFRLHAIDLIVLIAAAVGWIKCAFLTRDRWHRRRRGRAWTIPFR